MPDKKILDYIRKEASLGVNRQAIINSLLAQGWQQAQIDEALNSLSSPQNISQNSNPPLTQSSNHFPGFKELLGQAWKIYKDRAKTIIVISLSPVLFVLLALISVVSIYLMLSNINTIGIFISTSLILISIFMLILFSLWSRVSLLFAIKDRAEKIGTKTAFGRSKGFIFKEFIVLLLMGFITMFGYILFIIPGIIFSIWFTFSEYALVYENTGIIASLKRSKQYAKGKVWEIFYRSFVFGLFTTLMSIILTIIPIVNLASGIISFLVFSPLTLIYTALMFENIKNLEGKTISNPLSAFKKILITALTLIPLIFIIGLFIFYPSLLMSLSKKPAPVYYNTLPVHTVEPSPTPTLEPSPTIIEDTPAVASDSSILLPSTTPLPTP